MPSRHAASLAADVAATLPGMMEEGEAEGEAKGEAEGEVLGQRLRGASYPKGQAPLYALMVAFARPLGAAAPFDGAAVAGSVPTPTPRDAIPT